MPVTSLNSSVIKWPDRSTVHQAITARVEESVNLNPGIIRVGYFGSYARGDWGVGSDLDLIVIINKSDEPYWERALDLDFSNLPVPVDVLVYTLQEWEKLARRGGKFYQVQKNEVVWVYRRDNSE